jgi:hypothetical protein
MFLDFSFCIIGVTVSDTWVGLPVFWNGLPTGIGRFLFHLLQPRQDRYEYLDTFLKEHPSGFIDILNCDLSLPPRTETDDYEWLKPSDEPLHFSCYCHTGNDPLTAWCYEHASPNEIEWAYIVSQDSQHFYVFKRLLRGRTPFWQQASAFSFADQDIDWAALEIELLRNCLADPVVQPSHPDQFHD